MLTKKQILILFLISDDPGINGIYSLVKFFDRADFPSNIRDNVEVLLRNGLVVISERFDNGTEKKYQITKEGKEFLLDNFSISETIQYIETMENPDLVLGITKAYIEKSKEFYK